MFELFKMGGPLFMGILTIIFILVIAQATKISFSNSDESLEKKFKAVGLLKSLGVLALVVGILGQLIGLFSAFQAMETTQNISTSMLAGGLKVSLITTLYGMIIFIVSLLLALFFKFKAKNV